MQNWKKIQYFKEVGKLFFVKQRLEQENEVELPFSQKKNPTGGKREREKHNQVKKDDEDDIYHTVEFVYQVRPITCWLCRKVVWT